MEDQVLDQTQNTEEKPEGDGGLNQPEEKTFTQAEVDAMLAQRLARERAKMAQKKPKPIEEDKQEQQQKQDDQPDYASEIQKMQVQLERQKEKAAFMEAIQPMSIKKDAAVLIQKLVDFESVRDENGEIDADELSKQISKIANTFGGLKQEQTPVAGANPGTKPNEKPGAFGETLAKNRAQQTQTQNEMLNKLIKGEI